jgi:hypothetical protein
VLQLEPVGDKGKGGRKHGAARPPRPGARTHAQTQPPRRKEAPPARTASRVARTALPRAARPGSKPGSPAGPGRRAPSRGKKTVR